MTSLVRELLKLVALEAVPTVLILHDRTSLRSGLASLPELEPRSRDTDDAPDGADAMDITIPARGGTQAKPRIQAGQSSAEVLILTTVADGTYLLERIHGGAGEHLSEDSAPETIVAAIKRVMSFERGGTMRDQVIQMPGRAMDPQVSHDGLTSREIEVLKLLATGLANKQIAQRLKISAKTVRNHASNLYQKLRISGRSEAVLYAVKSGLVEP